MNFVVLMQLRTFWLVEHWFIALNFTVGDSRIWITSFIRNILLEVCFLKRALPKNNLYNLIVLSLKPFQANVPLSSLRKIWSFYPLWFCDALTGDKKGILPLDVLRWSSQKASSFIIYYKADHDRLTQLMLHAVEVGRNFCVDF